MQRKGVSIPPPLGLYPAAIKSDDFMNSAGDLSGTYMNDYPLTAPYCPFEAIHRWERIKQECSVTPLSSEDVMARLSKIAAKIVGVQPESQGHLNSFEGRQVYGGGLGFKEGEGCEAKRGGRQVFVSGGTQ
jgi:hypothetical protein